MLSNYRQPSGTADCSTWFPTAFVHRPVPACFLQQMREREGLSSDGLAALWVFWTAVCTLVTISKTSVCSAYHIFTGKNGEWDSLDFGKIAGHRYAMDNTKAFC